MLTNKRQLMAVGLIASLCCSPISFAAVSWHPVMAITAGAAFNNDAGVSKNFPANNSVFSYYNYDAHHPTQNYALFGAFLGAEFMLQQAWSLQAGLSYYVPSEFIAKGIVTQGVDAPSSNQYGYQYSIHAHQLLAEGKLLYNWNYFHPYLSGGLGVSFNDSENFAVNIQPPFTTFSNQFGNNSISSFTYIVGFGVDYDITQHARLGLGYRFTDFGRSKTGNGVINTIVTANSFSQEHLYSSELVAQFTVDLV